MGTFSISRESVIMESTQNFLKLYVSSSTRPVHEALSNKLYLILADYEGEEYKNNLKEWIEIAKWLGLLINEEV